MAWHPHGTAGSRHPCKSNLSSSMLHAQLKVTLESSKGWSSKPWQGKQARKAH